MSVTSIVTRVVEKKLLQLLAERGCDAAPSRRWLRKGNSWNEGTVRLKMLRLQNNELNEWRGHVDHKRAEKERGCWKWFEVACLLDQEKPRLIGVIESHAGRSPRPTILSRPYLTPLLAQPDTASLPHQLTHLLTCLMTPDPSFQFGMLFCERGCNGLLRIATRLLVTFPFAFSAEACHQSISISPLPFQPIG